jgi:hypothetical protein
MSTLATNEVTQLLAKANLDGASKTQNAKNLPSNNAALIASDSATDSKVNLNFSVKDLISKSLFISHLILFPILICPFCRAGHLFCSLALFGFQC